MLMSAHTFMSIVVFLISKDLIVKIVDNGLYFIFTFPFYFIFLLIFYF